MNPEEKIEEFSIFIYNKQSMMELCMLELHIILWLDLIIWTVRIMSILQFAFKHASRSTKDSSMKSLVAARNRR